jgi:hypothetical protein
VHPAAKLTAGDLVRRLTGAGLPARRVIVYRAEACKTPPPAATEALNARALAAVLIHSPRAGQIAAALIAGAGIDVAATIALGLSPACIEPLPDRRSRAARRGPAQPFVVPGRRGRRLSDALGKPLPGR